MAIVRPAIRKSAKLNRPELLALSCKRYLVPCRSVLSAQKAVVLYSPLPLPKTSCKQDMDIIKSNLINLKAHDTHL